MSPLIFWCWFSPGTQRIVGMQEFLSLKGPLSNRTALCQASRLNMEGFPMCGIVGYVGHREAEPILVEGLRRLEYRGYDSAGMATLDRRATCTCARRPAASPNWPSICASSPPPGCIGISHTRWATHGPATDRNAHPHLGGDGAVAVVHNGVIENYAALKRQLQAEGVAFRSDTDTEVIAHLDRPPPTTATCVDAVPQGAAAAQGHLRPGRRQPAQPGPDRRRPARQPAGARHRRRRALPGQRPVGALAGYTRQGRLPARPPDLRPRRPTSWHVLDARPRARSTPASHQIDWDAGDADKGVFAHYMLKEIYEQPEALENAMRGRLDDADATRPLRRPEPRRRSNCAGSSASS